MSVMVPLSVLRALIFMVRPPRMSGGVGERHRIRADTAAAMASYRKNRETLPFVIFI
jgi:hypothetical protein